ncbi:MAG: hypothetical protein OEY58_19550 [Gammaproteobacteria bacterium]|nr:hypothetical protein [Gammaproteobacteria bacterium]
MRYKTSIIVFATVALLLFATTASAEDLTDVLKRILNVIPFGVKVVLAIAAAYGVWRIASGFNDLRTNGTAQVSQMGYRNPVIGVVVGLLLLYLATFVGIGGETLFGSGAKATNVENTEIRF